MVGIIEWSPILLGAFRALGLVVFLPLGWDLIGLTQRFALMTAFAFAVPVVVPIADPVDGAAFDLYSAMWFLVAGALVGLPLLLASDIAASLGELLDVGRGVMIADVLDPLQSVSASHLSVLARYSVWVFFLASGGMIVLLRAVSRAGLSGSFGVRNLTDFGREGFYAVGQLFADGLKLVLPIMIVFLLCELVVGVVAKVSSNLSLSTEGVILKLVVCTIFMIQLLEWMRPIELVGRFYG